MTPNEEAYVNALHAELAYMKAQPGDHKARIGAIEDEIARVSPATPVDGPHDEPADDVVKEGIEVPLGETGELEAAVDDTHETAVLDKPKSRRAKSD